MLAMRAREEKTVRNAGREGGRWGGERSPLTGWEGAIEWSALKVGRREKLWKKEGDEKWRETTERRCK